MPLLITPLNGEHRALGAKMVPFAGWEMPVQYPQGILAEHQHTRTQVSLFDICHMGEFRVRGPAAAAALDGALARAVADQKIGSCRYNFLLQEDGGVLDDLIVYRLAADEFYLVVNAGCITTDFTTLASRVLPIDGVTLVNESDATAKLDLQGPLAENVLVKLGVLRDLLPVRHYHWTRIPLLGLQMLVSRTGYTGEDGFELYFPAQEAVRVWRAILAVDPVKPAGLGARDTLRLEMGFPLYGDELDPQITPVEAGFGKLLKLEQPRHFFGARALRERPPQWQIAGLKLDGRRAARHDAPVLLDGKIVGRVTSGCFAPSLGCAVALARLAADVPAIPGQSRFVLNLEHGASGATAVPLPFYHPQA